ncbi:hypothetical protein JCM3765_007179 [Sporobolomyces pararoseus]
MNTRSRPHRNLPRASSDSSCDSVSSLYSYPTATDTLPVYEQVTLQWNPACVKISGSSTIDLYLNVQQDSGLVAVHEWTDVNYAAGKLDTMLKPNWWNASTGAGSVQAQLGIVPSGQPIWNTPAPSGPLFTVSYNGSYPSVTESAPQAVYTGPSVESVADKNSSSSPTGGKLGAAIGVPLIVVALAIAAYVTWNRYKKRPQKKRFSAVVDQRMSMISQGTWQPRPSMASRPGSFHPSHRPSGSMYSTGNRHSYFADPNQRNSTYSALNAGSPLRPPQPAEMRQRGVGEGDRVSRVSFAGGERPSFSSSRAGHGKTGSIYTRTSMHQSQLSRSHDSSSSPPQSSPPLSRNSPPRNNNNNFTTSPALTSSTSSSSLLSVSSRFEDPISRSGTREELRDSPSVTQLRPYGSSFVSHSHKPSATSSLRNELSSNNTATPPALPTSPSDPFLPSSNTNSSRPKLSPLATNTSTMTPSFLAAMPQLSNRSSQILSPDQALASYSFARALSPAPPTPGEQTTAPTLSTSKSTGSVKAGFGKMLKKLKSSSSLQKHQEEEEREKERSMSPFEDPRNEMVIPPMPLQGGLEWYGDEEEVNEKEEEGKSESSKENEKQGELSWKGGKAF